MTNDAVCAPQTTVWLVAQRPSRLQRHGRYVPESIAHPGKMLPALAAEAIGFYTKPGDLVLDPMCGIGTTLIEAIHLGRDAVGIEYEPRWASLANANIDHANRQGASGHATVHAGDARHVARFLARQSPGTVGLLLTSPPYGRSVHGHTRTTSCGVIKSNERYGTNRHNLAHRPNGELLAGFGQILTACLPLLRPDGLVVISTRPWRRHGVLIDFPTQVMNIAIQIGLQPVQRCAALLAAITNNGQLVHRASFFQIDYVRKARARGIPLHVIAHEDLLIFSRSAAAATWTNAAHGQADFPQMARDDRSAA